MEIPMSDKTVADLMHKGIIACRLETPMNEVVRIISDADVHAIVVMDQDNQAVGVISHTDIIRLYGEDLSQHVAQDVMTGPPLAIGSDAPARAAADLMLERGVRRLLVTETEEGMRRLVGIVSTTDLVRDMRGSRWTWYMG
jgi:CBS domain-containing protein